MYSGTQDNRSEPEVSRPQNEEKNRVNAEAAAHRPPKEVRQQTGAQPRRRRGPGARPRTAPSTPPESPKCLLVVDYRRRGGVKTRSSRRLEECHHAAVATCDRKGRMTRGVRRLDGLVRALLEQHLVSGDCGLEVQESYDFEIIHLLWDIGAMAGRSQESLKVFSS